MSLFEEYGKALFQQEVANAQFNAKIIELKKAIVEQLKEQNGNTEEHKAEEPDREEEAQT